MWDRRPAGRFSGFWARLYAVACRHTLPSFRGPIIPTAAGLYELTDAWDRAHRPRPTQPPVAGANRLPTWGGDAATTTTIAKNSPEEQTASSPPSRGLAA